MTDARSYPVSQSAREPFERFIVQAGFTDWTRHEDGYLKPLIDRLWRAWTSDQSRASPAPGTFAAIVVKRMADLIETANKDSSWEMEAVAEMMKATHLLTVAKSSDGGVDPDSDLKRYRFYREALVEEIVDHLRDSYPDHAWLNAACAAIRSMTPQPASVAQQPTKPWVCCNCDADLSCGACGVEQPNDSAYYERIIKENELLTDRLEIAQKIIAEYQAGTTAGAKADVAAHGMAGARGQRPNMPIAAALARRLCQMFDSGGESQRSARARHASAIFQLLNRDDPGFLAEQAKCDADPVGYLQAAEGVALPSTEGK